MSNLFGMLYTGVSGIMAAQVGMDVVGNNLNNLLTPGYSRQMVSIQSKQPIPTIYGPMGTGAEVTGITRAHDELLTKAVRSESSSYNYFASMQSSLGEAMLYFNELETGAGLGDPLKQYFSAWQELSSTAPDNTDDAATKKYALLEKSETLARQLREGYGSIEKVQGNIDTKLTSNVQQMNDIISNIAILNTSILSSEAGAGQANDLRDQRDLLVDQLSTFASVVTNENENGQISVFIGGQVVVDRDMAHKLEALPNPKKDGALDLYFSPVLGVGTVSNAEPVNITESLIGGSIAGDIKTRDELLEGYLGELDVIARALINETNKSHVLGQGSIRFDQLSGTNSVGNATSTLDSEVGKLPFDIKKGSFSIDVYDKDGKVINTISIDVDPSKDTLASIADKVNSSGGLIGATIGEDNNLELHSNSGNTFGFSADTSGFLAAAGLNTFFAGTSAKDIDITELIKDDQDYIATGSSGAPGDNSVAKNIAGLQFKSLEGTSGRTIGEAYGFFIGMLASDKSQIDTFTKTKELSFQQSVMRNESVRGVSENEEITNLTLFQRTFEANSRYINVIDEMINTVVNGLGA